MVLVLGAALLLLALANPALTFVPVGGGTATHVTITRQALLQKVTETCKAVAEAAGHEFKPTGPSPEELVKACLGPTATGEVSGAKFHAALQEIYIQNGLVDRDFVNSAPHHFNSESFVEGRSLIIQGLVTINASIHLENFKAARETLGRILHVLQDFYSHSNWVELGNVEPFRNLLQADLPLENLADIDTPTCSDCEGGTCPNPILPDILWQKKLTSGYMGIFSNAKPTGKCSHGGSSDLTSTEIPRGGIHKDLPREDDPLVHAQAVNTALYASLDLLEDIRAAAGDNDFLRMMGITRPSVLCLVIDTTGSMADDIAQARKIVHDIIDSKKETQDEPSEYILVPFNNSDFGPMIRTTDPDKMKQEINALQPSGDGDAPEMCLSGLQLALTGAPAASNIYVFTDASANDIQLKATILALIRSTKSTVSFFMTGNDRRRRRSLRTALFQYYEDLALASGGQAIRVSKAQLPQATDVILDTSTSALVTVLQRARRPGNEETFPFELDESLRNITIYITGTAVAFTLTNPSGLNQNQNEEPGKLGSAVKVGNLLRIRLHPEKETGPWKINIRSTEPYTLKVTGQSTISFIYDFVERFEGPHPGYAVIAGCPPAGQPALLRLSVMGTRGPTSVTVREVALVTVSNPETVSSSTITDEGDGNFLVNVDSVPHGKFMVLVNGTDKESNSEFQRQSTTQMTVSQINIKAVVSSNAEPGKPFILPFTVTTEGSDGIYEVTVNNDKNFTMAYSWSLMLTSGEPIPVNLTITPPATTPTGTDVTVIINVKPSDGCAEPNYIVLRLSVVEKIVGPECNVYSVVDDCPADVSTCGAFTWRLTANLTDTSGTGIESISLRQGSGNLTHTSLSDPLVQVKYEASCCSQTAEFLAVDKAGNEGRCYHSIDMDPPTCQMVSLQVDGGECPKDLTYCRNHKWTLVANLTDGSGTGVERIYRYHGDGNFTYSALDAPVVEIRYQGTCCAQEVDLRAVDKAGNEGRCYHSILKDLDPPSCQMVSLQVDGGECPKDLTNCRNHKWTLVANLTDGNGTGVERIYRHHGDGNFTYSPLDAPVVEIRYQGTCCIRAVDLRAVDKAGNEGRCYHSIVKDLDPPTCHMVSLRVDGGECPKDLTNCRNRKWTLVTTVTDGGGTGVERIYRHYGNGPLFHSSLNAPVVAVWYQGTCCTQEVDLRAVDIEGNEGRCYYSILKDLDPPTCQMVSLQVDGGECPKDLTYCRNHKWTFVANLTDGNGTGVERIYQHHGDGNFTYSSLDAPVVELRYQGTCCTRAVDLRAIDKAGNEGRCYHSIVKDLDPPSCHMVSLQVDGGECPKDLTYCRNHKWTLVANLTDGNGTGVERIYRHHGDGNFTYSPLDAPVVELQYQGTCCIQAVDLRAVDKAGNEGRCYHSIVKDLDPPTCHMVSLRVDGGECPKDLMNCRNHKWTLVTTVTDGGGTGVERIYRHYGNGPLFHSSLNAPVVAVWYQGTCCTQEVDLRAVDIEGNEGKCYYSIVKDLDPPTCQMVSLQVDGGECPKDLTNCRNHKWTLVANLTDGNGTGVERIYQHHGDGNFTYSSLDAPVVSIRYQGTCCAQEVDLRAIDKAGNEGRCYHSIVKDLDPPTCHMVSLQVDDGGCPKDLTFCRNHKWTLVATLTDGGGTGVERIYRHYGDGNFTYSPLDAPVVELQYQGTCCTRAVDLRAVDKAGNEGRCYYSIVKDLDPPTCHMGSLRVDGGECPRDLTYCRNRKWTLVTTVTDGGGTGVERIYRHHGDGTLFHSSLNAPVVAVWYQGTCCTRAVDLRAIDIEGNEGRCYYSVASSAGSLTLPLWLCLLATSLMEIL